MTERPAGFFTGTGMPDPQWWMALWPDPAQVLAAVGVSPGMNVIDLCCGDGWFTAPLSKLARKVKAIDIDAEMVEAARARLAENGGAANCEFAVANAYDLATVVQEPYDQEPYDHVFLANAFHGVPDGPRLARAVRAVLRPGGLFAVVNWYARPRETTPILGEPRGPATEQRMTLAQTVAGVEPGGLKFRNAVDVSPYHYGAVFERPS